MKKILHVAGKVILSLILLLPIVGTTGLLGEATRDLYNTDLAFSFIEMLVTVMYINYIMAAVLIVALIALWTKREALAALLIAPITVNVVAFHLFLDGGLLTGGALLGNIMLLLNAYLLWRNRESYASLLRPAS
jgi:putative oxidoreductase